MTTPWALRFYVGNRDLFERNRRFVARDRDDYPMGSPFSSWGLAIPSNAIAVSPLVITMTTLWALRFFVRARDLFERNRCLVARDHDDYPVGPSFLREGSQSLRTQPPFPRW